MNRYTNEIQSAAEIKLECSIYHYFVWRITKLQNINVNSRKRKSGASGNTTATTISKYDKELIQHLLNTYEQLQDIFETNCKKYIKYENPKYYTTIPKLCFEYGIITKNNNNDSDEDVDSDDNFEEDNGDLISKDNNDNSHHHDDGSNTMKNNKRGRKRTTTKTPEGKNDHCKRVRVRPPSKATNTTTTKSLKKRRSDDNNAEKEGEELSSNQQNNNRSNDTTDIGSGDNTVGSGGMRSSARLRDKDSDEEPVRRSVRVTDASLQPGGALNKRLQRDLFHWPMQAKPNQRCTIHRWASGVELKDKVVRCNDCAVHLCVNCYQLFHMVPNLVDKKKELGDLFLKEQEERAKLCEMKTSDNKRDSKSHPT